MSASMLTIFLKQLGYKVIPILHDSKKHGLTENVMNILSFGNEPKLLWIPDAGTNDTEQCKILKEKYNYTIVISDHHLQSQDNPYAIIVNNQMSPNVTNKEGCGCLVTWRCIHNIDSYLASQLISYVMVATLGDGMNLTSQENRCFVKWGRMKIHPNLQPFVTALNKDDTNRGFSYGMIPCLNSMIRLGTLKEKEQLFCTLCGETTNEIFDIASIPFDVNDVIERCKYYHSKQQTDSAKLADSLKINDDKNVIISEIKNTPLTGLVANKIMSKYNKPTILVHKKDNQYIGSMRSPIEFSDIVNKSNVAKCVGHKEAAGIFIDIDNIDKFKEYIYHLTLSEPYTDVLISSRVNSLPSDLYSLKSIGNELWGNGISEPTFHIYDIYINSSDIRELGANKLTIKFTYQGVDFIHFFTSNKLKEELHMDKATKIILNVIGTLDWNEYRGKRTKQVIMDKIECVEDKHIITMEDLF